MQVTLAKRIQEAMGKKSPADIARATKRTESAVSQWLDGTTKSLRGETAAMLEVCTGYRAAWLISGKGAKTVDGVEDGPRVRGLVPLISWVQAGSWNAAVEGFSPSDVETWLPCIAGHSECAYALRVRGDSMTAPSVNSRTYPQGCVIFVDPRRKQPSNGDRVIAKLCGADEVTFKIYNNEDGRQWLQPLNPSHEPIRNEFAVLGTVIGKWEDE